MASSTIAYVYRAEQGTPTRCRHGLLAVQGRGEPNDAIVGSPWAIISPTGGRHLRRNTRWPWVNSFFPKRTARLVTERVDVVVIGGGPAGLSTAEYAAKAGAKVVLLEKEQTIGRPVHTSGATLVPAMVRFGIPDNLYHVVQNVRICAPSEEATYHLSKSTLCVIDVTGVYQHLAEMARLAGAEIRTGCNVGSPVLRDGIVRGCAYSERGESRVIEASIVVDAGGYKAAMSKATRLHEGFQRFGVGAEHELLAPRCRQDEALLIVGNRYAPAGYAWVFPWGAERVRVGVGILHSDSTANPRDYLAALLADLPSRFGCDVTDSTIVESHFGLIPSDGLAPRFTGDAVLAVGDAAGQPSLVVGEGIRIAIVAGRVAGETAGEAIKQGRFDRSALQDYENRFRSEFETELKLGFAINRRMAQWDDAEWDEKIRLVQGVPADLMADALLSRFPIPRLLVFFLMNPSLWPRMVRYGTRFMWHKLARR